jgi:hypothetical protein
MDNEDNSGIIMQYQSTVACQIVVILCYPPY